MKYLLLLLLFACSEPVEMPAPEESKPKTLVEVYAIEQLQHSCIYQIAPVVPWKSPKSNKIEAPCGQHQIGDRFLWN